MFNVNNKKAKVMYEFSSNFKKLIENIVQYNYVYLLYVYVDSIIALALWAKFVYNYMKKMSVDDGNCTFYCI